eukprot:122070-Pyramimonas_sp.AAC.1
MRVAPRLDRASSMRPRATRRWQPAPLRTPPRVRAALWRGALAPLDGASFGGPRDRRPRHPAW